MRRSLRSTAISLFSSLGGFCSLLRFATHVVLHRISIRTLCEPSWPCAGWGSVESRCWTFMPRSRSHPFMDVEVTALCHHPGSLERADECTSRGNRLFRATAADHALRLLHVPLDFAIVPVGPPGHAIVNRSAVVPWWKMIRMGPAQTAESVELAHFVLTAAP
jgi:hypothetical protein